MESSVIFRLAVACDVFRRRAAAERLPARGRHQHDRHRFQPIHRERLRSVGFSRPFGIMEQSFPFWPGIQRAWNELFLQCRRRWRGNQSERGDPDDDDRHGLCQDRGGA